MLKFSIKNLIENIPNESSKINLKNSETSNISETSSIEQFNSKKIFKKEFSGVSNSKKSFSDQNNVHSISNLKSYSSIFQESPAITSNCPPSSQSSTSAFSFLIPFQVPS